MTPADVITEVRKLLQDTLAPLRYSDADLLGYLNQTVKRMVTIRPDLFNKLATVTLTPNDVMQSLPADAHRLIDIYYVVGKNSVTEVERPMMQRTYPQWVSDPAGTPLNFIRHERNPTKFFVYPKPAPGTEVVLEYVAVPADYGLSDTITAPTDGYLPALVDGVMFLASSIDDEHVDSNRAQLFLQSFTQALGVDLQSRVMTDNETLPPQQPQGRSA